MSFTEEVTLYIKSGMPGISIQTDEPYAVVRALGAIRSDQANWVVYYWDCHRKMQSLDTVVNFNDLVEQVNTPIVPTGRIIEMLNSIPGLARKQVVDLAPGQLQKSLFILNGWHRPELMNDLLHVQAIHNLMLEGKQGIHLIQKDPSLPPNTLSGTYTLIFLGPNLEFPTEIRRMIFPIRFELPGPKELLDLAKEIDNLAIPEDEAEQYAFANAARGLTRMEAETAFALCAVRKKTGADLAPAVLDVKTELLRNQKWLEVYDRKASFSDMAGVDQLGLVCSKMMAPLEPGDDADLRGRGALLIGVSGGGKTQAIKCMGRYTNRLVLHVMLDALRSKYVGDSENHFNHVLEQADAMAPCILAIDEAEKMLATSSEDTVSTRMFGRLLQWQQDHTSDVYLMVSVNDIRAILERNPEFVRSERFDFHFFFDLPRPLVRKKIWRLYAKKYNLPERDQDKSLWPEAEMWTGADIKQCCRIAKRLDIPIDVAAREIRPLAEQAPDVIEGLRHWAHDKCRAVDRPGIYQYETLERKPVRLVKSGRRRHTE